MEHRNRFQGMNSASLCSLAGPGTITLFLLDSQPPQIVLKFHHREQRESESVLYVYAPLVFRFLGFLVEEKNIYSRTILPALMKTFTNSKNCSGSRIIISLSVIGRFLQSPRKICVNPHVQGGFLYDTVFQKPQVPVSVFRVTSESLKRVTGRIFRISK